MNSPVAPIVSLYSNQDLFRDLRPFLHSYRWRIVIATTMRLLADIAWLYPAYGIASLVTFFGSYAPGMSLSPVRNIFILWGIAIMVRHLGIYLSKWFLFRVSEQVAIDAQLKAISHLFLLDMQWHEQENSGNKLKKIERGGQNIDRILRMWINNYIEIAVSLFGMLFILARFDGVTSLLTFLFLVTYFLLASILRKRASVASHIVNVKEEEMNGLFFESINNIRSVKIMSMRKPMLSLLESHAKELYKKIVDRIFWFQSGIALRGFYGNAFRIGMTAYIAYGITQGYHEIGFLVLFHAYFNQINSSITELAEVSQDFVIARLTIGRMADILRVPVSIDSEVGKVAFPTDWHSLSLQNVSFAYGENTVLRDVSFEIKKGERIGIVGLSGAGKSTLFKLLLKEQEQSSGTILVDGIPLQSIGKEDYYRYVSAVLQETEVMNFTLRQNIVLANELEASNTALFDRSLDVAHVTDFLSKLPLGADTPIGEKGVRLSGGEKQRLGIARAVFKQPQILLMDEATSHLDIESEEKIRASLHEVFQSVTALVVAHRLTTIREMDRIIVIEDGSVKEVGTFDELTQLRGRFFDLWEKQKLGE